MRSQILPNKTQVKIVIGGQRVEVFKVTHSKYLNGVIKKAKLSIRKVWLGEDISDEEIEQYLVYLREE